MSRVWSGVDLLVDEQKDACWKLLRCQMIVKDFPSHGTNLFDACPPTQDAGTTNAASWLLVTLSISEVFRSSCGQLPIQCDGFWVSDDNGRFDIQSIVWVFDPC